jgi:chlorobactene glucosyltransferase
VCLEYLYWCGGFLCLCVLIALVERSLDFGQFLRMELRLPDRALDNSHYLCPLISVIIPARNEERFIERSARHILASNYSPLELILVDDRSQDGTLTIMQSLAEEDSRIRLISLRELPAGWGGKTNALDQGSLMASGNILVFTDADSVLSPVTLSVTLNYLSSRNLAMLSLAPGFTSRGFIEDVLHPYLAMGLLFLYPLKDINNPQKSAALASGCYIMITRTAYNQIGTWEAFRDEITEDIAMSRAVKARGLKFELLRGDDLVRTRPFNSLSEEFLFWKRSYYGALDRNSWKTFALLLAFFVPLTPFVSLILASAALVVEGLSIGIAFLFASSLLVALTMVVPHSIFLKRSHGKWWYGLAGPIGGAFGVCVALSTLAALIGEKGIQWRGTHYR